MSSHPARIAADIQGRVSAARQMLKEEGWDVLLVSSPASVYYLSGALIHTQTLMRKRQAVVLIEASNEPTTLIVADAERGLAARASGLDRLESYDDLTTPAVLAAYRYLGARLTGRVTIAVEKAYMSAADLEVLAGCLPDAQFMSADARLEELRSVKSANELEVLEFAAFVMDRAIADAVSDATGPMTEADLSRRITLHALKLGNGRISSATGLVAAGPNLQTMHHVAGPYRLVQGDILRIGCRAICDGYHGLVARTAAVGGRPVVAAQYARLAEAHSDLIVSMTPGASGASLYARAGAKWESLGLTLSTAHVGHGMGLEFRERPLLSAQSTDSLQAGMVLLAVSVVSAPPVGYLYLEDMVAVRADGSHRISNTAELNEIVHVGAPDTT